MNYRGDKVSTIAPPQQKKKPKAAEESFHKGWRVTGVPPGALEEARAAHLKKSRLELQNGKQSKEFIDAEWLRNARQKPVRAKPYSIPDAAEACAELARKSGWQQVTVTAIEKIVPKTEF
ncbi:hypothetical protein [Comamonas antarctica]|uniref:hypothetical protein n=1 Tax=Comamonas antarctica TaxID=2743470 RepID=UPI0028E5A72E|nr:hypothetical protein [Comamonas antarctica]